MNISDDKKNDLSLSTMSTLSTLESSIDLSSLKKFEGNDIYLFFNNKFIINS
jgi:hypothetical protein